MNKMSLQKSIQNFGIKQALKYMEKDPEENIPKLMDMVDKFAPDGWYEAQRNMIRKVIQERGNWYQLILRIYQLNPEVRKAFFQNFIFNASRSVGRKFDIFPGIKCVDCFDQTNRTDRNQILHPDAGIIKFFCNIHHKPQVMFNQLFSCKLSALITGKHLYAYRLIFTGKRRRKHLCASDIMHLILFLSKNTGKYHRSYLWYRKFYVHFQFHLNSYFLSCRPVA